MEGGRVGEGEIYVCVAGDAVLGLGVRGSMQRETAGPIIDGALLG